MKMNYLAPITDIVYINAQNILEKGQDSTGTQDGWGEDTGANSASFEEEGVSSSKSIWED